MKVLFIDPYGSDGCLDLVMRAQDAGHAVKWFFPRNDRNKDNGKGLVESVSDWREWARWADLIILADNVKYLREVDAWRKQRGTPVVGATVDSAALELDRTYGQKMFKQCGIGVVPYREFSNYDQAIAYVKKEMRRFVSKPCGEEPDKALSYVSKSPADLVYMLERWKRAQKLKGSFILQEFVEGTEMAVGGWIGPDGFAEGWTENFEFKKLMPGDVGCNTGEMGTAVSVVKKSRLAERVLKPLEDMLVQLGHTGYIDINCIVDEKGNPWPLEATARPGWPTLNIQMSLLKGDPVQWMADLLEGKDEKPWRMNEVAVGVVVAIGDFPHSHATKKDVVGVPIYGVTDSISNDLHFCNVMMGEAPREVNGKISAMPMPVSAGDYLLVATGTEATVSGAAKHAYSVVKKIEIPSSPIYRNDIGRRLSRQIPELKAHGFAAAWTY